MKRYTRKMMYDKHPTSELRKDIREWEFRWKNGMVGHKLYFGLLFFNKKDYIAAKKSIKERSR
jgi:hypothetical protein